MMWLRMVGVIMRLSWPHLLAPWRSPLLRWRLETYGIQDSAGRLLHADDITPTQFVRFTLQHHRAIRRFLRWAACL